MDTSMDRSVVDDAVHKILSYPPKPQCLPKGSPSVPLLGNDQSELHDMILHEPDSSSEPIEADHSPPSTASPVNRPSKSEDTKATFRAGHDPMQKGLHFVRLSGPDEAAAPDFRLGKPQQRTLNLKPTRGPAAMVPPACVASTTANQSASSTVTKSPKFDYATVEVEQPKSPKETGQGEESKSENGHADIGPNSDLPLHSRAISQSSGLVSSPQSSELEGAATIPNHESLPKESEHASTSQVYSVHGAEPQPDSTASNGPERLERENAATRQQDFKNSGEGCHDEDTDMTDGQTLVGVQLPGHSNVRSCSNSSSSDETIMTQIQPAQEVRKRVEQPRNGLLATSEATDPLAENGPSLDPEKIFKALAIHYQHEKRQKDQIKAREENKERDIQDLQTISQALHQQLQETENRLASQEEELTKYRRQFARCIERLKKLSDYVKGLGNDHTRLRDIGDSIQKKQQELQEQKLSINNSLKESKDGVEKERTQHRELVRKLRHDSKMLEQALNSRSLELMNENSRVRHEQGRNARLHDDLVRAASQYEKLASNLVHHETAVDSKIAELREVFHTTTGKSQPAEQTSLYVDLEECLRLLREVRTGQLEAPDLVQKLNLSNKEYADSISRLVSLCGSTNEATTHLESRLVSQLETEFDKLISTIETGHPLREQIMDLREMKATITERLKAAESSLVDSRFKITTFENREEAHCQKIIALEAEVAASRNQAQDSCLSALRLHEAEKQHASMKDQLTTCLSRLEATTKEVEAKYQENLHLQHSLEGTRVDLEKQQTKIEAIILEKAEIERQGADNEERLRTEFSKARNDEDASNAKFFNEIQILRNQLSTTEKNLEAEQHKATQLHTEKSAILESGKKFMGAINDLKGEITTNCETISQLEHKIEEGTQQKADVETRFEEVQTKLRELHASRTQETEAAQSLHSSLVDAEAMNDTLLSQNTKFRERIQGLEASLTTANAKLKARKESTRGPMAQPRASLLEPASASSPLRSTISYHSGREDIPVVEDSQDKAPKQPHSISNPRIAVGDSQETTPKQRVNVLQPRSVPRSSHKKDPKSRHVALKPRPIVKDSQQEGVDAQSQQLRPLSSDELSRNDPLSFMPKEIQDLVGRSSSPLTDAPSPSSPVIDGGVMFPPSPVVPPRADATPSHSSTDRRTTSTQGKSWAYNSSVTSTKSHSVTTSLFGRSPSRSSHLAGGRASQLISSRYSMPPNLGIKKPKEQMAHVSSKTAKGGGLKRLASAASVTADDSEIHGKKRRLSSEVEKHGLGPKQVSPVKKAGSRQRKSTRQHSQRSDKFSERFQQELKKAP